MTAQGCATAASLLHDVSVKDIMGYNRKPNIVRARWHAWRLARVGGWTYGKIAKEFGRDWTTVRAGLKRQYKLSLKP